MSNKKPKNTDDTESAIANAMDDGRPVDDGYPITRLLPATATASAITRQTTLSMVEIDQNGSEWCVAVSIARLITHHIVQIHGNLNTDDMMNLFNFYLRRQVDGCKLTEETSYGGLARFTEELNATGILVADFLYDNRDSSINSGMYDVQQIKGLYVGELNQGRHREHTANIDAINGVNMERIAIILNETREILRTINKKLKVNIKHFHKNDDISVLQEFVGVPLIVTLVSAGITLNGKPHYFKKFNTNFDVLQTPSLDPDYRNHGYIELTPKRDDQIIELYNRLEKHIAITPTNISTVSNKPDLHATYVVFTSINLDTQTATGVNNNSWKRNGKIIQTTSATGQLFNGTNIKFYAHNLGEQILDAIGIVLVDHPDKKRKASGITKRKNKNNRTKSANKPKSKLKSKPKKRKTKKNN